MKKLFLFIVLLFYGQLNAQVVTAKIASIDKVSYYCTNNKVEIKFTSTKNTPNLLVLIVDSTGHTLFLDNQFNFKGDYKRMVDLSSNGKGKYYLKITDGESRINKQFSIE